MKKLALLIGLLLAPILAFSQPTPAGGPPAATQTEVNAGTVANKYVSPLTLASWTGGGGSGTVTSVSVTTANGVSGSVATATTTPAITLTLGAITPTTVNGNTFTTGTYTLTGAASKTLTFNNTLTLAGTDSATITFQGTDTYVGRATTDTLTNKRITPRVVTVSDATSWTPDADASDISYQSNSQGAGTLTMNAPSGTPINGQKLLLKIKSGSGVQTYSWNAIYVSGSDVTLPTASTASKIDNIGFIYDSVNSKWQCVAVAKGY